MRVNKVDKQIPKDEKVGIRHNWIKGVLDERLKPPPEEPFI